MSKINFNGLVIDGDETLNEKVREEDLRVTGSAVFTCLVDADAVEITGISYFNEVLTCDNLAVNGKCVCKSELFALDCNVEGNLSVYGNAQSEIFDVEGDILIYGKISGDTLTVKEAGKAEFHGKSSIDKILINGILISTSVLSGESVEIFSSQCSNVKRIGVEKLVVKRSDSEAMNEYEPVLIADEVEALDCILSNCDIGELYCACGTIKSGCRIRNLLYRDKIEIELGAYVEKITKV